LRKNILEQFPDAFIIAFRGDKKMDVNEAIAEFKRNRGK
jgi:N-acetylmuramoyl-L-alanine amidase